jgi:hypothetical protein
MQPEQRWWSDLVARAESEERATLRDEAHEVFVAEAARCRLTDRQGRAVITTRSGTALDGELRPDLQVNGCVSLVDDRGRECLVPTPGIVRVVGSRPALAREDGPSEASLASWLRRAWARGALVGALDASGQWRSGLLAFVGADHVEIEVGDQAEVLPFATVEAWRA